MRRAAPRVISDPVAFVCDTESLGVHYQQQQQHNHIIIIIIIIIIKWGTHEEGSVEGDEVAVALHVRHGLERSLLHQCSHQYVRRTTSVSSCAGAKRARRRSCHVSVPSVCGRTTSVSPRWPVR
jgi:hypothetical protein